MTPDEELLTDDQLAERFVGLCRVVAGKACRFRHLRDEAESVALAALDEAIRQRDRSTPGKSFSCLFMRVATCRIYDFIRRETKYEKGIARVIARTWDQVCHPDASLDDADAFEALLAHTTPKNRAYLRLVYADGLTVEAAGFRLRPGLTSPRVPAYAAMRAGKQDLKYSLIRAGRAS